MSGKGIMYIDIETRGNYENYQQFKINDEFGSDLFLKKYEKLAKDKYNTVDDAYKALCGLMSPYGSICCVSMGFYDRNGDKNIQSISNYDEKTLVHMLHENLVKIHKHNFVLSGYNITNFDIPWMNHKFLKYGLTIPEITATNGKKPWELDFIELSDMWKSNFKYYSSLEEVCYELGIKSPKSNMDGSEVNKYFWEKKLDNIVSYCELDVSSTMDLGKILLNP